MGASEGSGWTSVRNWPRPLSEASDQEDFAAKRANGDRGPAGELQRRPSLELETDFAPRRDQRGVIAVDPQLDHVLQRLRDKLHQDIARFEVLPALPRHDAQHHAVGRCTDDLRGLARQPHVNLGEIGESLLSLGQRGLEGRTRVLDLGLIVGLDPLPLSNERNAIVTLGVEIGARFVGRCDRLVVTQLPRARSSGARKVLAR